ncbi:MAG: hypothetical protein AB8F94_25160 [Saprospiraceae bacterium]
MKNLKILTVLLISLISIGSCSKEEDFVQDLDVKLEEAFELKIDELATIPERSLSIKVKDVLEDSRCPELAMCTWAGQIKLEFEITANQVTSTREIIYQEGKELILEFGDYIYSIIQVTPDNQIDEVIELSDYTFTLFIEKK